MTTPPPSYAPEPDQHDQAQPSRSQRSELVIWGAHGGAGTSTLAAWLQPAWDAGKMRPEPDPQYPAELARGRVLVVACGITARSAAQATKAVSAVTRQGGHVAVLAVTSDGWGAPETAAARFRLLEPRVGAVVWMPFIPAMREAADPVVVPLPRLALRALAKIHVAAGRDLPI
jgi:hypothetical protein